MADIQIRAAEPTDAEAIFELFNQPRAQANTLQLPWTSLDERRRRLLTDPEGARLVAAIDGRVVGMLGLHLEHGPRRRDVANFGMAVHDEFANQGVGSALMRAMLELADCWYGLRRLELTVYADNPAAIHLYEKFGFTIEGTGKQYAMRGGEYVDAYFMARLRPSSSST